MKIVLVTGGFDPVHSGHLAYFKAARTLGDWLVVGLNSDAWLTRKKGRPFMPIQERLALVGNLGMVDEVIVYNDDDGSSCDAIRLLRLSYPDADIVFFCVFISSLGSVVFVNLHTIFLGSILIFSVMLASVLPLNIVKLSLFCPEEWCRLLGEVFLHHVKCSI